MFVVGVGYFVEGIIGGLCGGVGMCIDCCCCCLLVVGGWVIGCVVY